MACDTITTIVNGCSNNIGGLRGIWMFDMSDIVGLSENVASYSIDSIDIGGAPIPFELTRNTSNYTEESTPDLNTGSTIYTQTINLVFNRREAAKSKAIKTIGDGQRYLGALVKDANGLYTMFFDLQLSGVGEGSGTAKADGSKYNVTLMAENDSPVKYVSTIDALAFIGVGNF